MAEPVKPSTPQDPAVIAERRRRQRGRNWAVMLKAIKEKLESLHPASSRTAGSEGALIEKLYLSLDAVKNPWRNETMHVEGVYTDAEAQHILQCVAILFQTMAQGFDENGTDADIRRLLG